MRLLSLALLAVLVAPGIAGCVTPAATPTDTASAAPVPLNLTAPKVSARATLDALKAFSEAYPYRQAGTPTHVASRDALEAMFKSAGLETMRQDFDTSGPAPGTSAKGQNVIGIKWGEDRDHWVVVGAHYDVTEGAVYGTYDDGSGTIDVAMLGKALAKVATNRTLAFIEFDQEERGLVGSRFFVDSVLKGTFKHPVTIDAMLDLDMIGITWPHPAKLIVWQNSPTLKAQVGNLTNLTKIPADHVEYRKPKGGSSDGAAFIAVNVSTVYFWSDWDEYMLPDGSPAPNTPLPYVGPYPWWHKADTYETMVAAAGDEATLEKGFQTVLDICSPLILYMASSDFQPDSGTVGAK